MSSGTEGGWSKFERLVGRLSKITGLIGALAILAAALIVTEGVFVRKVLGQSTIWQIEMSVILLIYACFVGAALTQRREHHLNVDLVIIHLSPKAREITLLIVSCLTAIICLVLAVYSWPMWWQALAANEHSESLWGPPLWIPYLFLPLGMSLVFLQLIVQIAAKFGRLKRGEFDREAVRTELKDIDLPAGAAEEAGRE